MQKERPRIQNYPIRRKRRANLIDHDPYGKGRISNRFLKLSLCEVTADRA